MPAPLTHESAVLTEPLPMHRLSIEGGADGIGSAWMQAPFDRLARKALRGQLLAAATGAKLLWNKGEVDALVDWLTGPGQLEYGLAKLLASGVESYLTDGIQ
jgi:hypothetical protein